MTMQLPWSVEQRVRADAERVFVPADAARRATVGDPIEIVSPDAAPTRTGRIIEFVDEGERGEFFVVDLEPPVDVPVGEP